MTSKFERDLLHPAFDLVEHARRLERHYGTSFGLGFSLSSGDFTFAMMVASAFGLGRGEVGAAMGHLVHALLRWYDGGCPRFRLTHGLTTDLVLTDPSGVPMSEVRQPFPTYVVELPHPNGPLVWTDEDGILREPAYMIVHSAKVDVGSGDGSLLVTSKSTFETLASRRSNPHQDHLIVMVFNGMSSGMFLSYGASMERDVVEAKEIPFAEDSQVEQREHDLSCIGLAWRLAFNLPLYLRHRPSNGSSGGKTVNHDHGGRSTLYELGADVKLNKDLRDAARSASVGDRERWMIATRFIVRGHWKQQPHGPGRTERKLIFVQPYWKGSADAPLVARAHVDKRA